jgi:8-amino-7-oxononanoate synthase
MDGDCPNLEELILVSNKHQCYLVVDEAHALGVFNRRRIRSNVEFTRSRFARIMTFGKGLGCHGILGSIELRDYLINFARSFIYTTGLSPHSVATILVAYYNLEKQKNNIEVLRENIIYFNQEKNLLGLKPFVRSKSAIQSAIIPEMKK